MMITKELKSELEVAASADDVWAVYGLPATDFSNLIMKLLPGEFDKIETLEGDGGVGTIVQVTFPPGSVPLTYKEKYVTLDDHKRLLEVEQIEGGYLDMGCKFYMDIFHIIKKGPNSCVIVSKIKYEVPEELASQVEPYISIDLLASIAEAISNYVLYRVRKELKHELELAVCAEDVWEVYSSPNFPDLIVKLLPSVFEKIEILEGYGGDGTVLKITFAPGSVPLTYNEKFVTINDKKRLKEVKQIEGGYLDMGCTFYMNTFHILEKGRDSCIILSKTKYEVPNKEVASEVEPYISIDSLANMATTISNYVLKKKKRARLCFCC